MQRAYRMPMSRSFGSEMAIAALVSLANPLVAISRDFVHSRRDGFNNHRCDPSFLASLSALLEARFCAPRSDGRIVPTSRVHKMAKKIGEEVLTVMLEAIGGFFLALVVLHPLLTFVFSTTQEVTRSWGNSTHD